VKALAATVKGIEWSALECYLRGIYDLPGLILCCLRVSHAGRLFLYAGRQFAVRGSGCELRN
jgi:hypothetical protein